MHQRQAFHLGDGADARFCLATHPAQRTPAGGMLYVHPFAEEMNKSRRMAALAAAAFASRGWLVLQTDLLGCGDSAGDFGDATWPRWVDDIGAAFDWLRANCGGPLVLWGLRAGSLLIADWLAAAREQPALLLWQPVLDGRQHLTQFLRLRAAGDLITDADARAAMSTARSELRSGVAVDVAGYTLAAGLAQPLEASSLRVAEGYGGQVALVEVAAAGRESPSPALLALAQQWRSSGCTVSTDIATGPAFWQTLEVETAPELVVKSCSWLDSVSGAR